MAFRLKRTHPFFDDPVPEEAARDDRALFAAARHAADRGLLSRRALLRAATGLGAWMMVLERPAFAEKVAGRKGYAVQGILGRDQLLGGVVEPENPAARDTLSAAWGRVRSVRELRGGGSTRLAEAATEFTDGRERQPRTQIDDGGIRPHLESPFDARERYVPVEGAQENFRRHERSAQRRVREVFVDEAAGALDRHPSADSGTRFVVVAVPTHVWCNRVGTVKMGPLDGAKGSPLVLPAGTTLTYHGRSSNSVLVNHPVAAAAAKGRATFVDARHLVDLAAKKRLFVYDRALRETYEPDEGCLRRDVAKRLCAEKT